MKPLFVLLAVFSIGILIKALLKNHKLSLSFVGKLAMSSMLVFTAIAHFIFEEGMRNMLPGFLPYKTAIIYATGIFELIGAIGLLIPRYAKSTGQLLIIFLTSVLPANVYAALHNINPVTGALDGFGPEYLFFRIPLQLFFVGWIYLFAVKTTNRRQLHNAHQ